MTVTDDDPKPQPPPAPDPLDCCGQGCMPCIHDLHERDMERYRKALAAWLARHPEVAG